MRLPQEITTNLGHLRYGVGAVVEAVPRGDKLASREADYRAVVFAISALFPEFPVNLVENGVVVRRDALGKPSVEWQSEWADRMQAQEIRAEHCPISNTSDGDLHLVFAAHSEHLVGVGIDAVWLPRLESQGKDRAYLMRFARQFMSETEFEDFEEQWESAEENALRVAVAAHFSLMEATSKALGTGLKIGLGMGRSTSLPKKTIGVGRILLDVSLHLEDEAVARWQELGIRDMEAYWGIEGEFLIALVLLWS